MWSDGEPIQDVDFLLFSKTVNQKVGLYIFLILFLVSSKGRVAFCGK